MDRSAPGEFELSSQRNALTRVMGCMLVVVAAYILYRGLT